jgi:hypothetical protein
LGPGEGSGTQEQIVIPKTLIPKLLELMHEHITSLHSSTKRTTLMISQGFWWPTLKDVKNHCKNCNVLRLIKNRQPEKDLEIGQTTSKHNPRLQ